MHGPIYILFIHNLPLPPGLFLQLFWTILLLCYFFSSLERKNVEKKGNLRTKMKSDMDTIKGSITKDWKKILFLFLQKIS